MFAACCKATATLNCRVVASAETGLTAGKSKWVACPSGYVMTGCNVFAESGKSGGAKVFSEFSFYPWRLFGVAVTQAVSANQKVTNGKPWQWLPILGLKLKPLEGNLNKTLHISMVTHVLQFV